MLRVKCHSNMRFYRASMAYHEDLMKVTHEDRKKLIRNQFRPAFFQ